MISAWHLLWVVPLAGAVCAVWAALIPANARAEEQGYKEAKNHD